MGLRQKAPERLWRGSAASTDPHAYGCALRGTTLPILASERLEFHILRIVGPCRTARKCLFLRAGPNPRGI